MALIHAHRLGVAATEYIVLLILVAFTVIALVRVFGSTIGGKIEEAQETIDEELSPDDDPFKSKSDQKKMRQQRRQAKRNKDGKTSTTSASASPSSGDSGGSGSGGSAGGGTAGGSSGASAGSGSGSSSSSGGGSAVGGGENSLDFGSARVNPIILLVGLAMVFLLVYVMFAKKKDS